MSKENVSQRELAQKGAAAPKVIVVQGVPFREGAKAPNVPTPDNVPSTAGPVSVTPTKAS